MSPGPPPLTRADLPAEFTPESLSRVPVSVLRQVSRPGNGVLDPTEQRAFDEALREFMRQTRARVGAQMDRADWAQVLQGVKSARGPRGGRPIGREDRNLERLAKQIGQQIESIEQLAPEVDWSFAQPDELAPPGPDAATRRESDVTEPDDHRTIGEVTDDLTDNVELVSVISEIADIGRRTLALEQQRDLQNTRGVFFGFVVSVAVLVAGWAPVVAATSWSQRWWILALTLATCALAGAVYAVVRTQQRRTDRSDGPTDAA